MGEATAVRGAPTSQGWEAKQDLEEGRAPDCREDEQGAKTGSVTSCSLLASTACLPDRPLHTHLSSSFLLLLSPLQFKHTLALNNSVSPLRRRLCPFIMVSGGSRKRQSLACGYPGLGMAKIKARRCCSGRSSDAHLEPEPDISQAVPGPCQPSAGDEPRWDQPG